MAAPQKCSDPDFWIEAKSSRVTTNLVRYVKRVTPRVKFDRIALKRDLELKARSGICEDWVLDGQEQCLYGFQQPGAMGYAVERIGRETESIAPLAFPACVITGSEFLRLLS